MATVAKKEVKKTKKATPKTKKVTSTKKAAPKKPTAPRKKAVKKLKPRMFFSNEETTEEQKKAANCVYHNFEQWIHVNGRNYEVSKIHFYTKEGVKYTTDNSLTHSKRTYYSHVTFDQYFVWKRSIKFDSGDLMLKAKGKNWRNSLSCDLYIPLEYFEADGAKEITEIDKSKYQKTTRKYIESEHIKICLSVDYEKFFDQQLKDFMKKVKDAKTPEELNNAVQNVMQIHSECRDYNRGNDEPVTLKN